MNYDNFPVGTVRGPFHNREYENKLIYCFMVQGSNGWVYFKGDKEGKVRKQAEDYAATMEMT